MPEGYPMGARVRELAEGADVSDYLVRLGPPGNGATIHRSTCRYAKKPHAARWVWADRNPEVDWLALGHGLKQCQVCMPPSPAGRADA